MPLSKFVVQNIVRYLRCWRQRPLGGAHEPICRTRWGYAGNDSGHQNLRRALADLRKSIGTGVDNLIHTTNSDIELDLAKVTYVGDPAAGAFLEDINVTERDLVEWVDAIRASIEYRYSSIRPTYEAWMLRQ